MPSNRINNIRSIVPLIKNQVCDDGYAKKILFSLLSQIKYGRLILTEQRTTYEFGQSASQACITARIDVHDRNFYRQLLLDADIGAAESFMSGFFSSTDLLSVLRLFTKNSHIMAELSNNKSWLKNLSQFIFRLTHKNTQQGSKNNIAAHYDLGNDFFAMFLDQTMMYSAAIYDNESKSLQKASINKLKIICEKLQLSSSDHVIEIGTGWGGFACYAAQNYGCQITTTTISKQQYEYTKNKIAKLKLEHKVKVILQDYRELQGQYDKLVSIEMIEAVGHEFYQSYFSKCSELLKPDGQMLIQSILIKEQRFKAAKNHLDFIKRYIFPGGCLPSQTVIQQNIANHTDMQVTQIDDITYDYAKTLSDWKQNFLLNQQHIINQGYSEKFIRMWLFYFDYCQAGFMERHIHTSQLTFAKPLWRDPRYPK